MPHLPPVQGSTSIGRWGTAFPNLLRPRQSARLLAWNGIVFGLAACLRGWQGLPCRGGIRRSSEPATFGLPGRSVDAIPGSYLRLPCLL